VHDHFLKRSRKFTPENFFFSCLHLVSSTNKQGYHFALARAFQQLNVRSEDTPTKSSFSEFRSKVRHEFFSEIFQDQLEKVHSGRKTFKGLYVYAVDGSDFDLPASSDILENGFRGARNSKETETHYPKMHINHTFDVLNDLVTDFRFSPRAGELTLGLPMIAKFEKNSVAIYDKLYAGQPLFEEHARFGSFFVVRAKIKGTHVAKCIRPFLLSRRVDEKVLWRSKHRSGPGVEVRLIKIKHPKTGEIDVFVTNLPRAKFSLLDVERLYLKRWSIESSYRDLISTLKIDQWHSDKLNGILQEIFCLLWLVNSVKSQLLGCAGADEDAFSNRYRKSNFKFAIAFTVEHLDLLGRRKRKRFTELFYLWWQRTRENRRHYLRSYPRQVRAYGTGFSVASQVPRRKPAA
jgi:hypothetical protein